MKLTYRIAAAAVAGVIGLGAVTALAPAAQADTSWGTGRYSDRGGSTGGGR